MGGLQRRYPGRSYPFVAGTGRDNGILYWGQFGMAKISAGAFDGPSATGNKDIIGAARVQLDFWDPEGGYYLNGTYYGDKNLLAIGGAAQVQNGNSKEQRGFSSREENPRRRRVHDRERGRRTYEQAWRMSARLYGSDAGAYGLVSYLFPPMMGQTGRFEVMGKYAVAKFTEGVTAADVDYTQKTTEANVDYIIKDFKTRLMLFFKDTRFDAVQTNFKQVGIGLQVQM